SRQVLPRPTIWPCRTSSWWCRSLENCLTLCAKRRKSTGSTMAWGTDGPPVLGFGAGTVRHAPRGPADGSRPLQTAAPLLQPLADVAVVEVEEGQLVAALDRGGGVAVLEGAAGQLEQELAAQRRLLARQLAQPLLQGAPGQVPVAQLLEAVADVQQGAHALR